MKIAMIGQKGIPVSSGGVERHVEELGAQLIKNGNEVFAYTRPYYSDKRIKAYKGINLISLFTIHTKHLDTISHVFLSTLHALIKNFDIIHYHGVGPALLSFIPRLLKTKTRVIVTFHCIDRKQKDKWGPLARLILLLGEWAACKFPHQTITTSKGLQNYCLKKYNTETIYIPNGISSDWKKIPQSHNIKNKFNLKKNGCILIVSRLMPNKGIHYLISAYKKIKTDKKLVIVGEGNFSGRYINFLKKISINNDNIIFTGTQSGNDLKKIFNNAYLTVNPSESEGFSTATIEAMACAKTVLVSDIKQNMEVIGNFGFSFKNKDIDDLKEKLEFLLNQPELVKTTGQKAQKYVLANYDWQRLVKKVIKVYQA